MKRVAVMLVVETEVAVADGADVDDALKEIRDAWLADPEAVGYALKVNGVTWLNVKAYPDAPAKR